MQSFRARKQSSDRVKVMEMWDGVVGSRSRTWGGRLARTWIPTRQSAARRVLFIIRSQSAPTLSVHEIISSLCGCSSCVNLHRDIDRSGESKSSNITASGNFVEQVVGLAKKSNSELTCVKMDISTGSWANSVAAVHGGCQSE